jgi:uncharacterized protein (DUF924 family)
MAAGLPLLTMSKMWYEKNEDYDALCRNHFADMVRAAGTGKLEKLPEWNESVEGVMSQIILCDQLARNCFRGMDEAFAYDSTSLRLALQLLEAMNAAPEDRVLRGEFYPPFVAFMMLPLIHSEAVENHEHCLTIIDDVQKKLCAAKSSDGVITYFDYQRRVSLDHKVVLDRFGRYPHRNQKLGRNSTSEEKMWLEDIDNLPGWAKSQG